MNHPRELIYELTLKPFFFKLNPESAHELSRGLLQLADSVPFLFSQIEKFCNYESDRLNTNISGIQFKNPLGMAAGFDKTCELYPFLARLGFGYVELGTITAEGQTGNPKPRIFRYEKDLSLVNRLGFNNPGSEKAYKIISSQKKVIPRGINVGKTKLTPPELTIEDYTKTLKKLSPLCDYAVINISSPNTPGLRGFQEKENFIELIEGIRKNLGGEFLIPTFVKLAPDLDDSAIQELLEMILSLKLSVEEGGISGRPLRKRSTDVIRLAYKVLKGRLPIIGVGGIDSFESALEKILAGASLIQIYTGYIYKGPFLPYMILEGIDQFLQKQGVPNIAEIVGKE
jgi:dihydroorotate dehydrogenase